ncbi:MAG: DnaB-like helicase C-terminal domain-containing protein [Solibacillus sp.]
MLNENAVLGTILKFPYLLADSELKVEYFQSAENRNILMAMKDLASKGLGIDLITLLTHGEPLSYGGADKLSQMQNMANESKFDSYVEMLVDKWRQREKMNILEIAARENWDLNKITMELNNLATNKVNDHNTITDLVVEVAEDPWNERVKPRGVNTGLRDLQAALNGLPNGELIIIGARPSMGKTDVMLHLSKSAGWDNCLPIIFSLEMNAQSLRDRLIASIGPYNRSKMKDPYNNLTDEQKKTWMDTLGRVSKTNMHIFDKSGQTVPEIRMKVRKIKNENPDMQIVVFIDYLTLIKPVNDYNGNMNLAVSDISRSLKELAKEFNCPVVTLSQLSRGVERREDKRPMMSDIRDSGSVEQDADIIMFIYRDAYYSKDDNNREMELIIAKNRNGGVGTIKVEYNKFTGILRDL